MGRTRANTAGKAARMETYIMLSTFTQQGLTNIQDGPERAERFRQAVEAVGVTLGRYDLVGVIQVPDAQAIAQLGLRACAGGNIRTETLRAFPREEMQDIIAGLR